MAPPRQTFTSLAADLSSGRTTSRALVDDCIRAAEAPDGEGKRVFVRLNAAAARKAADAIDQLRAAGHAASPYAGIPIVIKDLADIAGEDTAAGSKVLAGGKPAVADAPVVARLRQAGLVLLGRTNMTEFAYSGLGINPHYGTPTSPWDRASKRVPGGSSSGSAVAVAEGMALGALGTDTGGSCRIPAAFNGVVGLKPTARRVPTSHVVPLSTSLDSIGPIAPTVECCRVLDGIMAGEAPGDATPADLSGCRFLAPETIMLDDLDSDVAADFDRTLTRLSEVGAHIERRRFQPFDLIAAANQNGGLSAAESWHWHRDLIETGRAQYDPRVLARILRGKDQTAADYVEMLAARRRAIAAFEQAMQGYDALLSPTVAVVAPRIADCEPDAEYGRINLKVLRNTAILNILDGCSIAVPMHRVGAPPTSLMISGPAMTDRRIFALAASIERGLA